MVLLCQKDRDLLEARGEPAGGVAAAAADTGKMRPGATRSPIRPAGATWGIEAEVVGGGEVSAGGPACACRFLGRAMGRGGPVNLVGVSG